MEGLRNVRNRFALLTRKGELAAGLLAALCLVMLPGCPGAPTDACADNPCDDSDNCTVDTCTADDTTSSGFTCTNDPVDCADDGVCNPADGECVECLDDTDCDNGDFCDGDETCDDSNACVAGSSPCGDDETCIEDTDTCGVSCVDDADCASEDDGNFCTGDPVCDTASGACGLSGSPCAAGEVCDETGDACVECLVDADCAAGETCDTATNTCSVPAADCNSNGDCADDGLFCTGDEFCNTTGASGVCESTGDPCQANETCNETDDTCDPIANPGDTLILTDQIDVVPGTSGDDLVVGNNDTYNTGDTLQLAGGTDRANFTFTAAENDLVDATSLEQVFVRVTAAVNLDLVGYSGYEQLWYDRGTANLTLENVDEDTAVGCTGGDGAGDYILEFNDDLVNGTSNSLSIVLDDCEIDDLTVEDAAGDDGFEILNIDVSGDNTLDDILSDDIESIFITGGSSLTVTGTLDDATTVDASASTCDVEVTADNVDFTFIGGGGDDVCNFGAGEFDDDDSVNGGDGDDVVGITLNAPVNQEVDISETEVISVQGDDDGAAENFTLDIGDTSDATTFRIESQGAALTADTITLDNAAFGPMLMFRGDGTDANQIYDNITIEFTGATGSSDPLTVVFNNRGSNGEDLDDNNRTQTVATIDVDEIEDVTVNNNDGGTTTLATLNGQEVETLTVVADTDFTITNALESDVLDTVNGTGTGGVTVVANAANTEAISFAGDEGDDSFTGGPLDDDLVGNDGDDTLIGLAGADTLLGGANDDTLRGGAGVDDLDGEAGSDTFQWDDGDEGAADDLNVADPLEDFELTGENDIISVEDAGALNVEGAATLAFSLEGGSGAGDNFVVFNANSAAATTTAAIEDVIQANHNQAGEAIIGVVRAPDDNVYVVYDDDSGVDNAGANILVLAVIDTIDGSDATAASDLDNWTAANCEIR